MADERGGERREGAALVLEAPAELPEQLAPRHAGDALAEEAMEDDGGGDELLDVELFRDIELLLDSGRAEIQEAYLAAIDSLVGDHGDQAMADVDHWNASQPQPLADMELELSLSHQHQTLEEASSKSEALEQGSEESMEDGVYERERELLEREAKFLEAQREFLQFKASAASSNLESFLSPMNMDAGWETRAEDERRSLEAAQRHQAMLSQLLAQHQKSVCALEVALMQAPITHYRLSLMTPMESYIHLGKDPKERRAMLMSLRDTKIDAVQHFIEYQTRHIDPLRDFFYLDTFEKFGKFYTVDFTASFLGNTTLGEVADVIQDQFVIPLDGVSQMLGCVSNREYFDGIEEQFLHARIVDRVDVPRKRLHDRGFVVQESNTVFFRKSFPDRDGFTVLASDYVDKDDLHPYHSRSRIRKDISVGITLRRHVDAATGTSGVIMKRFSFIRHHLQHREPTPELVHAISTRVILWGQALRFFLAGRHPRRGSDEQRVWSQYRFPRLPGSTSTAAGTAGKEQEQELEQGDESGFESAA